MITTPQECIHSANGAGRERLAEFFGYIKGRYPGIAPVMRRRPMYKAGKVMSCSPPPKDYFSFDALKQKMPKSGNGKGCVNTRYTNEAAKPILKAICGQIVAINSPNHHRAARRVVSAYGKKIIPSTNEGGVPMEIRPYITFNGECSEAMELYKRAFQAKEIQVLRLRDLPPNPARQIPEAYMDRVVQVTLAFGDNFIRMSDCGPKQSLNAPESERVSIAVETSVAEIKQAFAVLSKEGRVAMELAETFYSPCAGVVFDKFGVMWNLVGQK